MAKNNINAAHHHHLALLAELIQNSEEWLMRRILKYALRHDYAKYTSTLKESWRLSISGLSRSFLAAMAADKIELELSPDEDYTQDPVAAFGIREGRLHRQRGIDIGMFMGLLKYYRQSYRDLVQEAGFTPDETAWCIHYLKRCFDRIEIGLCGEWIGGSDAQHILELRAANRDMTNEKNKYLTLFESLANPVILIDPENRIQKLNYAAAVLFNISSNRYYKVDADPLDPEGLTGASLQTLMPWMTETLEQFQMDTAASLEFEKAIVTSEDEKHYQVKLSRMKDISGKFDGTLIILNDVSNRIETEARLKVARDEAQAANHAKSAFLANMSHELRTPLNAIIGFAQLLERTPDISPTQRQHVEIINTSGEHLLSLIDGILDMSKIEAGRIKLEESSFDLYELLDGIEEIIRVRIGDKPVKLTIDRLPETPRCLQADRNKLRQVLINLLDNAVKHTDEGFVDLWIAPDDAKAFPACLRFAIKDSGVGIPAEAKKRIFEPFFMVGGDQRGKQGTGLGLAICRQFVELMGGKISVQSELGQGSIFTFNIRVHPPDLAQVEKTVSPRRVIGLASGQPAWRILVVEDNEPSRLLLLNLLQSVGFHVKEAWDGREALEKCRTFRPHLIWMDIRMPVMDGYEATRRIKAGECADAKIIALTAHVFKDRRDRIMAAGCDDFVRKPFREDEIFETMGKHLGVRYIYEQAPGFAPECIKQEDILPDLAAADLAELNPELLKELEKALVSGSLDRIDGVINSIRDPNPTLADGIQKLAHRFEYEKILSCIKATS